ncbi:MAG: hypothetical protein IKB85_06650 [Bacteroidales bacterium]|nr:hypothetical protein [Bacteroidales bacterium]
MKFEITHGLKEYETPVAVEMEIFSHGPLCTSSLTELENYDVLDELDW